MSLFKNVWKFLEQVGEWIANAFNGLSKKLQDVILPMVILIVNTLKEQSQGLLFDFVLSRLPEKYRGKVKEVLFDVFEGNAVAKLFLDEPDPQKRAALVMEYVKNNLNPDERTLFYTNLSATILAKLAEILADGKITILEAWKLVEFFYTSKPEPTVKTLAVADEDDKEDVA